MFFNSKGVAGLLSVSIAAVTAAFLSLIDDVSANALIVGGLIAFGSSYLLISITFEFLIFKEVNKIYSMLSDLKTDDFDFIKKRDQNRSMNPIKGVNAEIYDYASQKQQEIDELKKMEAFRREFFADVSHELKTPIFSAQGFIHTLLDGAMDDPVVAKKFLTRAGKALDGLDKLVQNLLSISKMESGDISMNKEKYDIKEQVEEIYEQFEAKSELKQIELIIENKKGQSTEAYADKIRIGQVMNNLISNAMKYCDTPSKVTVKFEELKDSLKISVSDTGLGIPKEDINRIFERFYRVEKSRAKDRGGTGLGLAIVRHIVHAHGDSIKVESKVGKGSTFSFKLKKHKS